MAGGGGFDVEDAAAGEEEDESRRRSAAPGTNSLHGEVQGDEAERMVHADLLLVACSDGDGGAQ